MFLLDKLKILFSSLMTTRYQDDPLKTNVGTSFYLKLFFLETFASSSNRNWEIPVVGKLEIYRKW